MGTLHWVAHVSMMIAALLRRLLYLDLARRAASGRRPARCCRRSSSKSSPDVRELLRTIVIFPLEMIFLGGIAAGFVWGAYLTISCLFGLHCDQAFASMGIPDFKNFLRMKVEPNKLTIYPDRPAAHAAALGLEARQGSRLRRRRRPGNRADAAAAAEPHRGPDRDTRGGFEAAEYQASRGHRRSFENKKARLRTARHENRGELRRMQARLSMPASKLKAHYDVVVVGSGYGGGVAASRLARCGQQGRRARARPRVPARRFPRYVRARQRRDADERRRRAARLGDGAVRRARRQGRQRADGVRPRRHVADQRQCLPVARCARVRGYRLARRGAPRPAAGGRLRARAPHAAPRSLAQHVVIREGGGAAHRRDRHSSGP